LRDGEAFAEWTEAVVIRGFVGAGAHAVSDLVETRREGSRRWMILEHTMDGLKQVARLVSTIYYYLVPPVENRCR
jgi:hypothetical protein